MKYVFFILISIIIIGCGDAGTSPNAVIDPKDMSYSEFMDACIRGKDYQPDEVPLCENVKVNFCDTACSAYSSKSCNEHLTADVIKEFEGFPKSSFPKASGLLVSKAECLNRDLPHISVQFCVDNIVDYCSWQYSYVINKAS